MDMLVKLYELPPLEAEVARLSAAGIRLNRPLAPNAFQLLRWIETTFDAGWASECSVTLGRQPVACWMAHRDGQILGFACYDATAKGMFGPMGVDETVRGHGLGRALLIATLHDMASQGYAYAVIGGVGPAEFYTRTVGATLIPDSTPAIYQWMLADGE
ncbi:MAG: GNAT family N-acetyltransferase [Chloroflexi bacterium]|nr:GNAT family N-acetyltransferase [Chloroflexota bacterium]